MADYNYSFSRPKKKVTFKTSSSENYVSSEAYKAFRTNLLFCGSDIKTVLITSALSSEGKSTISSELSKSLSDSGKRTLLIDADMRKSAFLTATQRRGEIKGLSELLSGISTLDEVLFATQEENFDVIFSGHFPPNPVELLDNGHFKQILDELKKYYNYIIIDAPPLIPVIDAAVIGQSVDAAILVVSSGKSHRRDIVFAKEQLEKSGAKILGVVLNERDKPGTHFSKYGYKSKYYI